MSEIEKAGYREWIDYHDLSSTLSDPWPLFEKPSNLMIVVAGGRHPTHAYWLQSTMAPKVVNKKINLPSAWDELIEAAARDLGPI